MQMLKLTALSCKLRQSTTLEGEEKLSDLCNMERRDERKSTWLVPRGSALLTPERFSV